MLEVYSGGTWSATEPSTPGPDAKFASISCWGIGACVAVGSYKDTEFSTTPMIATLSDGTWTTEAGPLPGDAVSGGSGEFNKLESVSCASDGSCVAVGGYKTASTQLGLVDTLDDGTWTATTAAQPSTFSGNESLDGVSCPSSQSCAAVGSFEDSSSIAQGVLLNDSGGSWTAEPAPLPSDQPGIDTSMGGVSCAGSNCEATGIYENPASGHRGLLESYSGGTWSATDAPEPSDAASGNADEASLNSVDCATATSCTVVGDYVNSSSVIRGMIESIDSGTPTVTTAPLPTDAGSTNAGDLSAVSCISSDRCVAVGDYATTSSSNNSALIDDEVGGTWTALKAPVPSDAATDTSAASGLFGLSCTPDGGCAAGGDYTDTSGNGQGLLENFVPGVPAVTSVSPSTGPAAGGTTVDITGTGFFPDATVTFGSTPAQSVTYVSSTQLTAVAPTEATGPAGSITVDVIVGTLGGTSAVTPADRYTYIASTGYWEAAQDGGVFTFGTAAFYGSMGGTTLNAPIVGIAATSDRRGYWLVASDGGVFSFGDAKFFGSAGSMRLSEPIVGIAPTPSGKGYWLVATNGEVFTYGDASSLGSPTNVHLNQPVVGMASSSDGHGYWLAAADGGIFNYGDAGFFGSAGGLHLNKPVVAISATPAGTGYWLAAADGGVFTYGNANFYGSAGSLSLNKPVVGMATPTQGLGYWLVASDGGLFAYGNALFEGSMGGKPLNKPVVGMAEG
jgi:hypothetical protein